MPNAQTPVFSSALISAEYYGSAAVISSLDGTATTGDGGEISYQWYVSLDGVSYTEIEGATEATYTPPSDIPENAHMRGNYTRYFRVEAQNALTWTLYPGEDIYPDESLYPGNNLSKATAQSNSAKITVYVVGTPYFVEQPADKQVMLGKRAQLSAEAVTPMGTITSYQWQTSTDGILWSNAGTASPDAPSYYAPNTMASGSSYYRVAATATYYGDTRTTYSRVATVNVYSVSSIEKTPRKKLCRLRFLNSGGETAFAVDNNLKNPYSTSWIASGELTVERQNGVRRTVSVQIYDKDGAFSYNVNHLWFGREIALDEGYVLPDGSDYYVQQGIFLIRDPQEQVAPEQRIVTLPLVDKWAYLDGSLGGNLETTYTADYGAPIFPAISALLAEGRGNGEAIDNTTPVYCTYYDGLSQDLPDGTQALLLSAPYSLEISPGTKADVVIGFTTMLNAWVSYDPSGALRVDPSQDDILDTDKPVAREFSMDETLLLGMTYTAKNTDVYNDIIVVGEALDDNPQPAARAQDYDPSSPTNINIIGKKTLRINAPGYGTYKMCMDRAVWELKRRSVLRSAVNVSCVQTLDIQENQIITIARTDKPGAPVERHLILGYTRPLVGQEEMILSVVSVHDLVTATVVKWNE